MDKRNDKFRDFHGVTAWHKAGYTGKRGMSGSGEDFISKPRDHAGWTYKAFKEIAPDREIMYVPITGSQYTVAWPNMAKTVDANKVDTMFMSYMIDQVKADKLDPILEPIGGFCSLFNAIGNASADEWSAGTRSKYIHGVGAIILDSAGNVSAEPFSSVSEFVDFMALDWFYIDDFRFEGTSCAAPVMCGMAALVNDFFIDKTGAPLTNEAMYRFLKDNCVDMKTKGHDTKTGWGYVVLPPPETVDIAKYASITEDKPEPIPEPEKEETSMSTIYGKTASGLIEYVKAQLGKPYWWGTFGQTATAALYAAKKAQYPAYYVANDFAQQYGKRVHDCAGLIKGYLFSDTPESAPKYIAAYDKTEEGMYLAATEKGPITTMPKLPGVLVHMEEHVGVYVGDGEVIEARGHAHGVVKYKLEERPWTKWSKSPYIVYDAVKENAEMRYNTLAELPDWAKPTIEKLVKLGALKGDGTGFDLSEDMVRMFVINDRMGVYGK